MQKKITTALLALGLGAAGATSLIPLANAQDACCSETVTAIQQLESTVKQNFEELIKLVNKLVSGDFTFTEEINQNEARYTVASGQWVDTDSTEKTLKATSASLTQTFDQAKASTTNAANLVQDPNNKKFQPEAKNFSFAQLVNKLSFDQANLKTQLEQADQYIKIISGQANPVLPLEQNYADKTNPAIEAYRATFGNFTAAQSVGVNALNRLVANRTPNSELGKMINVNKSISPLELESIIATTPLNSAWMQKMVTATPADLQKEMVYLMAGMQYQLFQTNRQLEQLNATLAIMQLQELQSVNRASLNDLRSEAARSLRR